MRAVFLFSLAGFIQNCLPDPQVDPPEAVIETACLDAECYVVELSAANSTDADDYQWWIDGVDYGTDEIIAIDLADEALVKVELEVFNAGGSDDDAQYLFATGLTTDTAEPVDDGRWASVVAGVTSCNQFAVISTIGGCITNPVGPVIEHFVDRTDATGLTVTSKLEYDFATDTLSSPGFAGAVYWDLDGTSLQGTQPLGQYGRNQRYRAAVQSGQPHFSSYYFIGNNEALTFQFGHGFYLGDPNRRPVSSLSMSCDASGNLSMSATPI